MTTEPPNVHVMIDLGQEQGAKLGNLGEVHQRRVLHMVKWEYNTVKVVWVDNQIQLWQPGSDSVLKGDEAMDHLNGLGMDGWELVSTSGGVESDTLPDFSPASILWFKRHIEEYKRPRLAGVLPIR